MLDEFLTNGAFGVGPKEFGVVMELVGMQTLYACVPMSTRDKHVRGLAVVAHDADDDAEGLADLGGHIADVTYLSFIVRLEAVFDFRHEIGFPFLAHGCVFVGVRLIFCVRVRTLIVDIRCSDYVTSRGRNCVCCRRLLESHTR